MPTVLAIADKIGKMPPCNGLTLRRVGVLTTTEKGIYIPRWKIPKPVSTTSPDILQKNVGSCGISDLSTLMLGLLRNMVTAPYQGKKLKEASKHLNR